MSRTFRQRAGWKDFRSLETLCRRAGVGAARVPPLLVKELVDNALDASEAWEYGPLADGGFFVRDFGAGIDGSDELLAELFSIGRPLTSTNAKRMKLDVEPVTRKAGTRVPVARDVSREDREWLQHHRVELNAMSTPQFLGWLEGKMRQHEGKVVPPQSILKSRFKNQLRRLELDRSPKKLPMKTDTLTRLYPARTAKIARNLGFRAEDAANCEQQILGRSGDTGERPSGPPTAEEVATMFEEQFEKLSKLS